MSLMTIMIILLGTVLVNTLIFVFSSLVLGRLRTVPKPDKWDQETMMLAPAEMRAGKKLQVACYDNNPKDARDALINWAWASGEIAMVTRSNHKKMIPVKSEFMKSIDDLWNHLETQQEEHWFGDQLWHAFTNEHPELTEQLQMASS